MQENKNSIALEERLTRKRTDFRHFSSGQDPDCEPEMINSTLLENEVLCKAKEFLYSTGQPTDKLDFLMQMMIKTSRLEAGVISLEKKSQPLYDTACHRLGRYSSERREKQINVQVDCPENLVVSHDRKWTGGSIVQYFGQCGEIRRRAVKSVFRLKVGKCM